MMSEFFGLSPVDNPSTKCEELCAEIMNYAILHKDKLITSNEIPNFVVTNDLVRKFTSLYSECASKGCSLSATRTKRMLQLLLDTYDEPLPYGMWHSLTKQQFLERFPELRKKKQYWDNVMVFVLAALIFWMFPLVTRLMS